MIKMLGCDIVEIHLCYYFIRLKVNITVWWDCELAYFKGNFHLLCLLTVTLGYAKQIF